MIAILDIILIVKKINFNPKYIGTKTIYEKKGIMLDFCHHQKSKMQNILTKDLRMIKIS